MKPEGPLTRAVKFASMTAGVTGSYLGYLAQSLLLDRTTRAEKLKATPDGDGTLLDHSLILYGSAMSNSNIHNHGPLPVLVAGGALVDPFVRRVGLERAG